MLSEKKKNLKVPLIVLGILVFLIGVTIFAVLMVSRRMQNSMEQTLSEIKKNGGVVDFSDLVPPEIPDDQNAALLLEDIFAKLEEIQNSQPSVLASAMKNLFDSSTLSSDEKLLLNEMLESHKSVLDDVDVALEHDLCRFPLDYSDPIAMLLPHLQPVRKICKILAVDALLATDEGNYDHAALRCLQIIKLSDFISHEPLLISYLVSLACRRYALDTINRLIRVVDAEGRGKLLDSKRSKLIDSLEKTDLDKTLRYVLNGERCFGFFIFEKIINDPEYFANVTPRTAIRLRYAPKFVLRFLFGGDFEVYVKYMDALIEENLTPYFEVDHSNKPEFEFPWYAIISKMIAPTLGRIHETHTKSIAISRLVLLQLKSNAFIDPKLTSLSELAETIQDKQLMIDPFSGVEFKLAFVNGEIHVYSIGPNQIDENGIGSNDTQSDDISYCFSPLKIKKAEGK